MVWNEPILHVDMDSFFVEVERLHDPALIGVPVAVGGVGGRGVIASASYEARKFGVRSAQPTGAAIKACPHLIVVPPQHGRYSEVSAEVFAVFRQFTPLVEGLGMDEAFLDVGGLRHHSPSSVEVGERIRLAIRAELGLPASVGVASNKLTAKLASEAAKPDGLFHLRIEDQRHFLHQLPVGSLPGVGPATLASLARLGIATVAELAETPLAALSRGVGSSQAQHLIDMAEGRDPRQIEPDSEAKSVSVEETFAVDLEGSELVETALVALAHKLSGRLRRAGLVGRTVTLKVRYAGFDTVTRSHTIEAGVNGWRDLHREAMTLLSLVDNTRPVRLLGLGASNLSLGEGGGQLNFDGEWARVEDVVFEVRQRFGDRAINPARLLDS